MTSRLSHRGVDALLDTMVSGFLHDPLYVWLYPDASARPALLRPTFEIVLHAGLERGLVDHSDGFDAVAIWTPPAVSLLDDTDMDRWLGLLRRDAARRVDAALAGMAACNQHAPDDPHWTLHSIVVAEGRQGRGLGSSLLGTRLADVDASGGPAYLESSNIRNVAVYRRCGFAVVGEVPLLDGPTMRPMLRRAGRAGSPPEGRPPEATEGSSPG